MSDWIELPDGSHYQWENQPGEDYAFLGMAYTPIPGLPGFASFVPTVEFGTPWFGAGPFPGYYGGTTGWGVLRVIDQSTDDAIVNGSVVGPARQLIGAQTFPIEDSVGATIETTPALTERGPFLIEWGWRYMWWGAPSGGVEGGPSLYGPEPGDQPYDAEVMARVLWIAPGVDIPEGPSDITFDLTLPFELSATPDVVDVNDGSVTGPSTPTSTPSSGGYTPVVNPDGSVDLNDGTGTVATGQLPPSAPSNPVLTIVKSGSIILVIYDGIVIITYLIPDTEYAGRLSTWWTGFVDPTTGDEVDTPEDAVFEEPPIGGVPYAYFYSEPTKNTRPIRSLRYGTHNSSKNVLISDGEVTEVTQFTYAKNYREAGLVLQGGRRYTVNYQTAVILYRAGLGKYLTPIL